MIYEYKALAADTWPSPEQLDEFGKDGWRVLQMIFRREKDILIYFIREVLQ